MAEDIVTKKELQIMCVLLNPTKLSLFLGKERSYISQVLVGRIKWSKRLRQAIQERLGEFGIILKTNEPVKLPFKMEAAYNAANSLIGIRLSGAVIETTLFSCTDSEFGQGIEFNPEVFGEITYRRLKAEKCVSD